MNLTFKGNFGELDLKIDGKTATGVYQKSGTITGEFLQNKFIGKWQNKEMEGMIEFTILNDKLEGTWKKGLDPGPMKGKWTGKLINKLNEPTYSFNTTKYLKNYLFLEEYNEDWAIELSEYHFYKLRGKVGVLEFNVGNSMESILANDSSPYYKILYNLSDNKILPVTSKYLGDNSYSNDKEKIYETYLDTWHASIPKNYLEFKSFIGVYSLSVDFNKEIYIRFHEDYENCDGEIDKKLLNLIENEINGKTFYNFLIDVFSNLY